MPNFPSNSQGSNSQGSNSQGRPQRQVRSFVLRRRRLSAGGQSEYRRLLGLYGIDGLHLSQTLDPRALFGRDAPLWVDAGFGYGDSLLAMARAFPAVNCLGIEVHEPGIYSLLRLAEQERLSNLRVVRGDASWVWAQLPEASVDRLSLLFSDPWPKRRHHKRRLVNFATAALLASRLKPGAVWHLATDDDGYGQSISGLLTSLQAWRRLPSLSMAAEAYGGTRYRRRAERLGHSLHEFEYQRVAGSGARVEAVASSASASSRKNGAAAY